MAILLQIHAVLFRQVQRTQKLGAAQAGSAIKAGMANPVETFIFRDGFERGKEGLFYRRASLSCSMYSSSLLLSRMLRGLMEGPP